MIDLVTASTPLVAFEAQRLGVLGAVVSASHNAYGDNGIKLFAAGGVKLADDGREGDRAHPRRTCHPRPALRDGSRSARIPNRTSTTCCRSSGDRRLDGVRVVLDAANGAGSEIGPAVLRASGADVVVIADRPDGRNINDGCGATVPAFVAAAVVEHGADVGVALDGDADRLIAVDHTGRIVDGDHIIAICADGSSRSWAAASNDTVVVTVMTNLGFRLAMQRAPASTSSRPAVGDRYVLEALAAGRLLPRW